MIIPTFKEVGIIVCKAFDMGYIDKYNTDITF